MKKTVGEYTQRLIYENKVTYRDNADDILATFKGIAADPDEFNGRLKDSGYEPKHAPWNDERIAACFEALTISW